MTTRSLRYQTVYYSRTRVIKPATYSMIASAFILTIFVLKIWIKVELVEFGYELADFKKQNQVLIKQKKELELQKAILLRADNFKEKARQLGLQTVSAKQMVYVSH